MALALILSVVTAFVAILSATIEFDAILTALLH